MFAFLDYLELDIPVSEVVACSAPGQDATEAVDAALRNQYLASQVANFDPEKLKDELRGYGAWDEKELEDHEENIRRLIWVASSQLRDELVQSLRDLSVLTDKDVDTILDSLS